MVTYMGDAFPARVAGSLLHAIGLPELIAHSLDDYEALVLQLVLDPMRLQTLKARLRANRATHPLFDTPRFCPNLEALLEGLGSDEHATRGKLRARVLDLKAPFVARTDIVLAS